MMAGRHDQGARRKSKRQGRERGCWIYIPAEQLARLGLDPQADPPLYRTWDGRKRTALVQFYTEP
jgi:hypothetical protein